MFMNKGNCRNCGQVLTSNFCADCGQKADTHRFSARHVFTHDFIHGVFHLDKGFPYTAKELLLRPGHAIREYVDGKRVQHFHYITFLMIVVTVNVFINTHSHFRLSYLYEHRHMTKLDMLQEFAHHHLKLVLLFQVPFNAFITWLFFHKAKQNYAEHLVMNTYKEAGYLMINTFILFTLSFTGDKDIIRTVVLSTLPLLMVYSVAFYYQYFSKDYSNKLLLFLKTFLALMIVPALTAAIAFIVTYYSYDKQVVLHLLRSLSIEHYLL